MLELALASAATIRRAATQNSCADATHEATQHDQRYAESQWAFTALSQRKSGKPAERPTVGIFNDFSIDECSEQQQPGRSAGAAAGSVDALL